MLVNRLVASSVAVLLLVTSSFIILQRGGILAWSGAVVALLVIVKAWLWPSSRDAQLTVAVLAVWGLAWVAIWQYVKSVWESGEVVEIRVDSPSGSHVARVWVLDLDGEPAMYYDAPPNIAQQLLEGAAVTMTRNGTEVDGCANTSRVSDLSQDVVAAFSVRMEEKYQARNNATGIFYTFLGGRRDRIPILLRLTEC